MTESMAPGRVALTGGRGFLGWHTRAVLREQGADTSLLPVGEHFDPSAARAGVDGASRLIHIAGVNRADEQDIREDNVRFAEQVASVLRTAEQPPPVVVYANSTQAGNGSVYGEAKLRAGEVLADAAVATGAEFVDVRLPNLFGEHGRPFYNAVTATFCHLLAEGGQPSVENDKELTLLHAQDAAELLTGVSSPSAQNALEQQSTVSGLLSRLRRIAETYGRGDIPDISDRFERDLFNTYRSYAFAQRNAIPLTRHADGRGSFFELVRTGGGTSQSSFSTTEAGVTRGDHYHRRKVERFVVLAGQGRISLRRLFSDERVDIEVIGDEPVAVDMPTMWAHNITNSGSDTLYTSFWTNDLFDPDNPDTIAEVV